MTYFKGTITAAAMATGLAGAALAQDDYPTDTVTIQVPFSAGGSTDVFGRMLADWLGEELGGTFIVENTTGASGVIGTQRVAQSEPDGTSILLATPSPLVMQPLIQDELPYELWEDFRPVSLIWVQPVTLITRRDRFDSVEDFIAEAQANPGQISYGSAGINSLNHVSGVFFSSLADVELLHIPYQGINPAIADTLAGNVDAAFVTAASLLSMPDELHGLVAASDTPLPEAPDVPLAADVGLPDYIFSSYGAFIVPAATPDSVVDALNTALDTIFADPENLAEMESRGVTINLLQGDDLRGFAERQSEIAGAAIER